MEKVLRNVGFFFYENTVDIVEDNNQKFKDYPKVVIIMVLFLSYNVLAQGIADVFIKGMSMAGLMFYIPLRLDFLFLTAVSVLIGYQALKAMHRREIDVTRNSIALGLIVELGLVVSDVFYLFSQDFFDPQIFWLRMPFIVFTTANFFILIYIANKLNVFVDSDGNFVLS